MVDNSLGRYWLEHKQDSRLEEQLKFYVPPIITADHNNSEKNTEGLRPQTLTFSIPRRLWSYFGLCLQSVYGDLQEQGYSEAAAAAEIIKHNLFGIDIDDRCTNRQLVLTMTACSYDSYFRTGRPSPLCRCKRAVMDVFGGSKTLLQIQM